MVGGSSKFPYVREKVSEYFGNKELNQSDDCHLEVVKGAALLGHMLANPNETPLFTFDALGI